MATKTKQTIAFAVALIALLLVSGIAMASSMSLATPSQKEAKVTSVSGVSSASSNSNVQVQASSGHKSVKPVSNIATTKPKASPTGTGPVREVPTTESTTICICKGDMNDDGVRDFKDINPFSWWMKFALNHPDWVKFWPPKVVQTMDMNSDGLVNQADVNPFVALLSNINGSNPDASTPCDDAAKI